MAEHQRPHRRAAARARSLRDRVLGRLPRLLAGAALHDAARSALPSYGAEVQPARTWTPQGTVGMGGASTAIYPVATPGGYQIFARTPVPIWDPEQRFPVFQDRICLFQPGDRVRFVPVVGRRVRLGGGRGRRRRPTSTTSSSIQKFSVRNYKDWIARLDDPANSSEEADRDVGRSSSLASRPPCRTIRAGIGYWDQGFPPSGPMDSWSFRLANVLVGNARGAAGLECQFLGPTLQFRGEAVDRGHGRGNAAPAGRRAGADVGERCGRRLGRSSGAVVRWTRRPGLRRGRRRHRH